jgi:glycosyltransferase involved in cell wall biosynthesis
MKFSIITCTYNSEKYLEKNIEMLKSQTFDDFEHIFIDWNSTDKTVEIINEYKNEFPDKVKLYQQKPWWISKAMNEWIIKSSWEYIIHLHSDDSFYNEKVLENVNDFLCKNDYDWIYWKANVVENNWITSMWLFPNRKIFQYNSMSKFGKYFLKFFNYIPHQAVFIKKEVFEKYWYFDETISSSMDPDMWLRIRNKTKWSFIDLIVCNYMIREDAQSSALKNIKENNKNKNIVSQKYLNIFEFGLSKIFNIWIDFMNKTRR